jgi:hypothetical protein
MRLRVEVKLQKAIRRSEHSLPGLQAAIAQHTPQDATTVKALCRLVLDPAEEWDRRGFVFFFAAQRLCAKSTTRPSTDSRKEPRQFSDRRSTLSMTRICTGPLADSSLNPSWSRRAWSALGPIGSDAAPEESGCDGPGSALERVLTDGEIASGWWSVGKEAQAVIVNLRDRPGEEERLQAEIRKRPSRRECL